VDVPDNELQGRVAALMHKRPVDWRRAHGGYTPAQRWVVGFSDGSTAFVKSATGSPASPIDEWLRREHDVYSRLEASFLPHLLGWDDDGRQPILVLEDLSGGFWPPPWTEERVEAVLQTLAQVRATSLDGLTSAPELDPDLTSHWREVEAEPAPFLSLGLCNAGWLDAALPVLIVAALQAERAGNDLVHFDVRSDNLCFIDGRVLLVDWNFASRGNGEIDVAFLLPSLHSEGGPAPESLLPDVPQWAAATSGFFAARAGQAPIPNAPRVRHVQLAQLRSALPWAVRALGLPPLDGPNAP
jgi:hypothetical protein